MSSSAPGGAVLDTVRVDPPPDTCRAVRGVLWLATNGVVVKAAQTLVLLVLAATLAPGWLGAVAVGTVLANLAGVLAGLGTASALVHWRGDAERAARTAVSIGLGTGTALAVVLWAVAPSVAHALGLPAGAAGVVRGLTVTAPFLAVAAVTAELLRRRLRFARRVVPDCVGASAGCVVAVALLLDGAGVLGFVAGQVVQGVLTLLVSWVVHPPVLPGWRSDDARGLLRWGGPFATGRLLELVQLNLDYAVVAVVLGAAALGQYSLAFRVAYMPFLLVAVVVTGVAFPVLCRVAPARRGTAATAVTAATVGLVTPFGLGVLLLADHLELLGPAWAPAVPVLAALAVWSWGLALVEACQTVVNALGRTATAMVLRLAHLVCLAAALAATVAHGVLAVAIGQLATVAVTAVASLAVVRRVLPGFSVARLAAALRSTALAASAMAAVVLIGRALIDATLPSAASLVVLGGAGALTYVGVMGVLDRRRCRTVLAALRGGGWS